MTRHMFWPAVLVTAGIAIVFVILLQVGTDQPVAPEPEPQRGGAYVEGNLGYSTLINPILAPRTALVNPVDQDLSALVFEGLTSLDVSGQVTAALATDWEASADGTEYEFRLRKGVKWHDGAPFTAADVAFTIQAVQDPGYQGDASLRALWRSVTVEQVDDWTVRFRLEEPFPSFLSYTTLGLLPVHLLGNVSAADLPEAPFSKERPVGTGMFQVTDVLPDRIVLSANPTYWGRRPFLQALEFWFYGDEAELLTDLEGGLILGYHPRHTMTLEELAGLPNLAVYSAPSAGYRMVYLNLRREDLAFFKLKELRQALLYGLDRQALIDHTLGGQGLVADSPIMPFLWAHDSSLRRYGYDPERAIGLLDASGWLDSNGNRIRDKDGQELSFTLVVGDDPVMDQIADQIVSQWQVLGVDARVRPVDVVSMTTMVQGRDFDAALVEVALTGDPDPYPLWHSTQADAPGQNFSGFSNTAADLVMEQARLTADSAKRRELYYAFQQIFAEEVPSLLIDYPIYTYLVSDRVKGVQLSPLLHSSDRFRNVYDWYLEVQDSGIETPDQFDKSED